MARSNAPRFVSIGYHAGARMPAHVVTPGIAMLSTWTDAQLELGSPSTTSAASRRTP